MGPDDDVLARPGRRSSRSTTSGTDLALDSWPGDVWKHGGAPVWGWLSYDPELDLVYYGTGNPAPYNSEQRPGDNKWTTSVLARRPGDGSLVWAYQFTPHDNWDYDSNAEMILADLTIGGRPRKVLVHFDKNGFAYTIDRATGEVLVAEPFVRRQLGQADRSHDRPAGAGLHQAHRRVPRERDQTSARASRAGRARHRRRRTRRARGCSTSRPTTSAWIITTDDAPRIRGHAVHRRATRPTTPGPGGHLGAFIAWDAAAGRRRSGRSGRSTRCGAARGDRGRRGVLRHARRLVQGGRRAHAASCSGSSRSAPASWALRSRTAAPTASSTWRSTRASAGTGCCSSGDVRSDDPGRRASAGRLHARPRADTRARAASYGCSACERPGRVGALLARLVARRGASPAAQQVAPPAVRYEQHVCARSGNAAAGATPLRNPFAGRFRGGGRGRAALRR